MPSPTSLTLRALRNVGFTVDVCERWIAQAGIRRDLFGFADVIGVHPGDGILLVQTTTLGNLPARLKKARVIPALGTWLKAGGRFQVHGWCKRGDRWRVKIIAVQPDDLSPVTIAAIPRRQRRMEQLELF